MYTCPALHYSAYVRKIDSKELNRTQRRQTQWLLELGKLLFGGFAELLRKGGLRIASGLERKRLVAVLEVSLLPPVQFNRIILSFMWNSSGRSEKRWKTDFDKCRASLL